MIGHQPPNKLDIESEEDREYCPPHMRFRELQAPLPLAFYPNQICVIDIVARLLNGILITRRSIFVWCFSAHGMRF